MKDYEQLYYDSQYEIKQLKKQIETLETELSLAKKSVKKKLNIRKEIIKELNRFYKNREGEDAKNNR